MKSLKTTVSKQTRVTADSQALLAGLNEASLFSATRSGSALFSLSSQFQEL